MAGEQSEIINRLKDGWDMASKLAGKGVGEVSNLFSRSDESKGQQSGLYWNRGSWNSKSGLLPDIEFFESQNNSSSFASSVMQRLTLSKSERLFCQSCADLISVNVEQAVDCLSEAVAADTQFTDGYFLLGCVMLETGFAKEANSYFQKALLCQQGLGGKFKKYLPSFRMSIPVTPWSNVSLFPDLLGLNVLLALSWREMNNLDMAISVMAQILSVMPEAGLAKFFLSIFYLEKGSLNEINSLFENLEVKSTTDGLNLLILSKACQRLGAISRLGEVYDKALACKNIDRIIRYDILYSQAELCSSYSASELPKTEQNILKECPEYTPFFKRLDIKLTNLANLAPVRTTVAMPGLTEVLPNTKVNSTTVLPQTVFLQISCASLGRIFSLDRPLTTIGREIGDIVLSNDTSISSNHARIIRDDNAGCYFVEDMHSTNGTFLNGMRLGSQKQPIKSGDK
ncbi:FHA domain-containing protein, partial [bacterium]|nr:FHA domain-containing protein [bacterium]